MSVKRQRRSQGQSALLLAAGMVLALPILMAPKCFDYDGPPPVVDSGIPDSGVLDAMPDGPTDAAVDTGPDFVPAVPCPEPNTAVFLVRNLEYQIVCGCAEAEGKDCTVPTGTTVIWNFADGVEHNVSPVEASFERSSDRISGRHVHTFDAPGSYGYGCTLHPAAMSGYSLIVE
jgi:hypothetical protein